jgi:hypothetical protein
MDEKFRDSLLIDLATSQKAIQVQLVDIKEDLKLHIKRTTQNEVMLKVVEEKLAKDIDVIKSHVSKVQGAMWLLGALAAALTLAYRLGIFK